MTNQGMNDEVRMKTYALRETPKGYTIVTDLEIIETYHGARRYCHDTRLIYKQLSFAESKAHTFVRKLWGLAKPEELQYMGVIKDTEYRGELA